MVETRARTAGVRSLVRAWSALAARPGVLPERQRAVGTNVALAGGVAT